jgi:hypothetical protein
VARELKAGLLGLAVIGLLLVVVVASRAGHPTGNAEVTERSVPVAVENTVVTLITVVWGLITVAALVYAFMRRGKWTEPRSNWLLNSIVLSLLFGSITVGYWAISRRPANKSPDLEGIGRDQRIPGLEERSKVPPRHADFNWELAVAVVSVVLAGGTVVYLRMRPKRQPQAGTTVHEDLAEAVDTIIDDLRREPDARRAVIAAYANMERVLASHGLERRAAETPLEYLARILRALDVRETAVRSLTQLFEYAKFSAHVIDSKMKERAIAALIDIRTDLLREEALAA